MCSNKTVRYFLSLKIILRYLPKQKSDSHEDYIKIRLSLNIAMEHQRVIKTRNCWMDIKKYREKI